MLLPWRPWMLLPLFGCLGGDLLFQGPVFTHEPGNNMFPVGSEDKTITLSCKARGSPSPQYRWQLNGTDVDLSQKHRYQLLGGNLIIIGPNHHRDTGSYQCFATNSLGTVASREARLQFAYLEIFPSKALRAVSVRAGQGVVLLCGPPPHLGELSYSWIFNEYPVFVQEDKRRFISQKTGHLYIAKVEPGDVGSYTCVVTSVVTGGHVLGPPTSLILRADGVMGQYEPKIEVQFPETLLAAKGSTVKLECFALGNPVPQISWRRSDGLPLSSKTKLHKFSGVLEIPSFEQEDAGFYECMADNARGHNVARGRLIYYAKPHWVQSIHNVEAAIEDSLHWECHANGKPRPSYRWWKDGAALALEERIQIQNGALTISNLSMADSGMFQCIAENKHGRVYSSAQLRVVASAPNFSETPMKKLVQVQAGSEVTMLCQPRAAPQAHTSWSKGPRRLRENHRVVFLKNGGLRIANVTQSDTGTYTCIAENQFGNANGTTQLVVTEPTRITVAPSNLDVSVGESVVLPCQVHHDPQLHLVFSWYFNGELADLQKHSMHFERIGRQSSSGDVLIRNAQLKHSGQYMCMVQTEVDSVSSTANIIVRGSPGPPENVTVEEITDTTAQLSWKEGADNHSPILFYVVQARTPFSVGWHATTTVPDLIDGNTHTATVVELDPWIKYEFRVVASNKLGDGEPSLPSEKVRTEAAAPEVPPSEVKGGGGSRSELVITWDPVPEELHNGEGFGYVVAFRPLGVSTWIQTVVTSPDTSRYIFRNESILPFSLYEVKVGVYNHRGEGPFSPVATVFSAEEEPALAPSHVSAHSLSSSEIQVTWSGAPWQSSNGHLLGYEVQYWIPGDEATASHMIVAGNKTSAILHGLKSHTPHHVAIRAYNSAGAGPFSAVANATTKKTPPNQPPRNMVWNSTGSSVLLNWERVQAAENESEVIGYKVFYRTSSQTTAQVLSTNQTSAELQLPSMEDYIIQVKAMTAGGDGVSSEQIRVPGISRPSVQGSTSAMADACPVSHCVPLLLCILLNTVGH